MAKKNKSNPKIVKFVVTVEMDATASDLNAECHGLTESMHEAVCKALLEGDPESFQWLVDNTADVVSVKKS